MKRATELVRRGQAGASSTLRSEETSNIRADGEVEPGTDLLLNELGERFVLREALDHASVAEVFR